MTAKRVGREIDHAGTPRDGRGVVVALAADELLRASWAELALERVPKPAVPITSEVRAVLAAPPRPPSRVGFGVRGAGEWWSGGLSLFGADADLSVRLARRWSLRAFGGVRVALDVDAPDGAASARAGTLRIGPEIALTNPDKRSTVLAWGADVALYVLQLTATPTPPARATTEARAAVAFETGPMLHVPIPDAGFSIAIGAAFAVAGQGQALLDGATRVTALSGVAGMASVGVGDAVIGRARLNAALLVAAASAASLAASHCTDDVEVLVPGSSGGAAPAGSTSSGASASTGGGGSSMTGQGGSGEGGACARSAIGAPCTSSNECCSGLCALDPAGAVTCRPTTGCAGLGAPCGFASACCSLGCVAPMIEGGRTCRATTCALAGDTCAIGSDCCGGTCNAGVCQDPIGCHPAGEACNGDGDCCGGSCSQGVDGKRRCDLAQGCRVDGEQCAADGDCCSGRCAVGGDGVDRCVALADCTMADGMQCKAQAGEICGGDADCCTHACRPSTDGPKRCTYLGGCHQQCELCDTDASCCSGVCQQDAQGIRRCASNGGACTPTGEACGGPCCGGPMAKCDAPPMKPPKRCEPPPMDGGNSPDGTPCVLPSQCAGGACAPGTEGFVCASACRAEGESCSAKSDCCSPLEHDCISLDGPPSCFALIH